MSASALNKFVNSDDSGSDDDSEDEPPAKAVAVPVLSEVAARKKAAAAAVAEPATSADSSTAVPSALPKLKAMDIKKMNGDQLKENLKARSLGIQGQKKDLMQRLIDFENARTDA